MLEVKNLVKEYRPKKGKVVRAVDGISLKFPEKGMVFILGKSGSGKSTLLNLLGGLDKYDSGEIIIKGKSSKDFSQSEFDSYRNTYLGFIFQEYNILNDFNVAQNIAIALQLQGQKATSERINEILKEVDLDGYGGRKPSELSGGQKQRVAIARALVKNPEIIMADEPTGALDSKTGLQVFDTLKRLSKDKLVITITHDRDFAEMYGDRVIELKDGKVISDIEKYTASAMEYSEGLKVTDEKVISIKKGYVLTERDVALINDYLQRSDVLLSADDKTNGDLKRFARIGDDGQKESFRRTDESVIKSGDTKFRLIKSRLPLKNKIVIGASGLKNKPIRLIVTILLSVVAFTMFGLTDTMAAYNKIKATEKSIEESGLTAAAFTKSIKKTEGDGKYTYEYYAQTRFSDGDVEAFSQKTGMEFYPVLSSPVSGISGYFQKTDRGNYYYSSEFGGAVEINEARLKKLGFLYEGTLPTGSDQIAISKHFFDAFAAYGYRKGDKEIKPEEIGTQRQFLAQGPALEYGERVLRITAIIDTEFNDNKYSSLNTNEDTAMDVTDFFLQQEKASDVGYGYHGMMFVGSDLWQELKENESRYLQISLSSEETYLNFYDYISFSDAVQRGNVWFYDGTKTSLSEGETMVSFTAALNAINSFSWNVYGRADENVSEMIDDIYRYVNVKRYETEELDVEGYHENGVTIVTDEEFAEYAEQRVLPYLRSYSDVLSGLYMSLYVDNEYKNGTATVVGFFIDPFDEMNDMKVVLSPETEDFIRGTEDRKYLFVISERPTKEQWKNLIRLHYADPENDVEYAMENGVITTVSMLNGVVESLSEVFLYVGIGFAVFAALMLTNFISTSIVYKRREIGILRAVGARGSDVYGIFAIESVIIALINFVLSTIATGVITAVIGSSFRSEYHISISILNFGLRQVGLIFGVAVAVALIASFLPTFRISRQRPVDAIKK